MDEAPNEREGVVVRERERDSERLSEREGKTDRKKE